MTFGPFIASAGRVSILALAIIVASVGVASVAALAAIIPPVH